MSKNAIIWLLVIIVVVGGGWYLLMNNNVATNQYATTNQNPTTPTTPNTKPTSPAPVVPPLTLSTPTVQTSSNTSVASTGASVTGQITPNGTPTTYWFEYGTTNALGSRTASQQIGSGFYSIPAPTFITGLNPNTTYYYRLMSNNSLGTVYGSVYSFTTNTNPAPKAATPTVHTSNASNTMQTTASLNGQINPNGWQTNYWFEYGKDNKLGSATSITSVNDNNVSLTSTVDVSNPLTGLESGTKYYFRLDAQNQFGTVTGTVLNFTTKGTAVTITPVIKVSSNSKLGSFLVATNGMTLYRFTNDNGSTSTCYGGCATIWPAYSPLAPFVAANGINGSLSTTTRTDGTMQLTYKGVPVYFYANDNKPGDTNGQNVGGVWFVVKP
jgi:predicted lipoprotein with Yx(FWY)xxD motif